MARPDNSFTHLGGVRCHYARSAQHPYGTRGVPATFYCTPEFERTLDAAFLHLWNASGLGKAQCIVSAGAYTAKPGQHGQGKALDIDSIFWPGKAFVTLHAGWQGKDRKFYYGVEAILRCHFGVVLDYQFNAPHRDHFHVDSSNSLAFSTGSRSKVRSLQGILNHVWGKDVDEDGEWGQQTSTALAEVFRSRSISGSVTTVGNWLAFLHATADAAFDQGTRPAAAPRPSLLLDGKPAPVRVVVDDGGALLDAGDLAKVMNWPVGWDQDARRVELVTTQTP